MILISMIKIDDSSRAVGLMLLEAAVIGLTLLYL